MGTREEKWIQKWKQGHAFEPSILTNEKKFYFTVPYPYPTGPLHVGHGRTYTVGDVIARFQRVKGRNVLWPMAFHVTGTPILAVCDAIRREDVETTKLYEGYVSIYEKNQENVKKIVSSFTDPKNVARFFASHIQEDFEKMGYSIDWTRQFTTMDLEYQSFIQWQFKKFYQKGVLVKGNYPILYSPIDKNAVGEDDIRDGDTDKVTIQELELIKFKLLNNEKNRNANENVFLVASTLRPETVYGATNIWLGEKISYVKARVNNECWIIAPECVEKLQLQTKKVEILEKINANELFSQMVENPVQTEKKLPILTSGFVSGEKGTGIVYSVPGHAPWDYVALLELQKQNHPLASKIQPIFIVDTPGFEGIEAILAKHKATSLQHKEGIQAATEEVYKREFYDGKMNRHNGPLSGLTVKDAKARVLSILESLKRHDKLFEPSRKAFTRAGNPVLVAILDDQWFLDYSSREWKVQTKELVQKMPIFPEHFQKSIQDSLDWLEKRPCTRKRGLGTPFPFAEGWMIEPLSDSTTYMLFYIATGVVQKKGVKVEQLDESFWDAALLGKKLPSNDKRVTTATQIWNELNYWYPNDLRHTAPAHISNHISFFLFAHTLLFEEKFWPGNVTFNELLIRNGQKMSKSKGNVIPLQNAANEFGPDLVRLFTISSAGLERVADWKDNQVPQVKSKLNELEQILVHACGSKNNDSNEELKWLEERLRMKLGEGYEAYEKFEFMVAAQKIFFETLNEIKRFKKVFASDESLAVKRVMKEWLALICPITPFLSEEMGEKAGYKTLVSHFTVPQKPIGKPSEEIEKQVVFIESVLQDIEKVKKLVKGKQVKNGYIYSMDEKETAILQNVQTQLAKHANVQIKINDTHDPLGKMSKARKGRPALYLE